MASGTVTLIIIIIKWIFFLGFAAWILGLIGYGFYKLFLTPEKKAFFKYTVFRRKYPEDKVAWCIKAIEANYNETKVRKFCLLKGYPEAKTEELCFIFNKVRQQLKGGEKDDKRHKETSGENSIPEI